MFNNCKNRDSKVQYIVEGGECMNAKSSSTREEILTMLKKQNQLTVSEIANQLGVTEMAIRRHLNTLERDNLVETTLVRQAMGRPLNKYKLSKAGQESFPRNYKHLTLDFLNDLEEIGGRDVIHQLFEARLERLVSKYQQEFENKTFDEKVEKLAHIQNENGYMVELEQVDSDSFLLKEFNCPIAEVANGYKKACDCELQLFKKVLDTSKIRSMGCMANGDACCQYEIKKG